MKTAEEKAREWVDDNVVLALWCGTEYSDLYSELALLLKEQDRDTRHACAEAVNDITNKTRYLADWIIPEAHDACMNVKAV